MTMLRPSADSATVSDCRRERRAPAPAAPAAARASTTPSAGAPACCDRRAAGRRRTTVSATTSASLTSSSRPVSAAGLRGSPAPNRTAINENSDDQDWRRSPGSRRRAARARASAAVPARARAQPWSRGTVDGDEPFQLLVPLGLRFLEEVAGARRVEQLARDDRLAIRVAADVDDLRDQVARMARAHLELARLVVLALQVLDHHRVERQPALRCSSSRRCGSIRRWSGSSPGSCRGSGAGTLRRPATPA